MLFLPEWIGGKKAEPAKIRTEFPCRVKEGNINIIIKNTMKKIEEVKLSKLTKDEKGLLHGGFAEMEVFKILPICNYMHSAKDETNTKGWLFKSLYA